MIRYLNLSSVTDTSREQPVEIVRVEGYLDFCRLPELEAYLSGLMHKNRYRLVLDLGNLDQVSCASLGVLTGMVQVSRDHGGDLKVARPSIRVRNIMDMLGLSRLVEMYDDVDKAEAAFTQEIVVAGTPKTAQEYVS